MNKGIERGLKELCISYDTFFYQFNDWEKDNNFLEQFRAYLKAGNYTDVFLTNASKQEKESYRTEVSLAGKLYQTEYIYFTMPLQSYTKGYLEGIVNAQGKIFGGYLIHELIADE